jgi:hypothetical protein
MLTTTKATHISLAEQNSAVVRSLAIAATRQGSTNVSRKIAPPRFVVRRRPGTEVAEKDVQSIQDRESKKWVATNQEIERLELAIRQGSVNA